MIHSASCLIALAAQAATAEGAFARTPEAFDRLVGWVSLGIEAAGIGVIVGGGLIVAGWRGRGDEAGTRTRCKAA